MTAMDEVTEAKALPLGVSSQEDELIAPRTALELSKGKKVNIWTDSNMPSVLPMPMEPSGKTGG